MIDVKLFNAIIGRSEVKKHFQTKLACETYIFCGSQKSKREHEILICGTDLIIDFTEYRNYWIKNEGDKLALQKIITTFQVKHSETDLIQDSLNEAIYFVVIADTNLNYFVLRNKMFNLNRNMNASIDTMGRYFNKTKDLIALPDNDEDEIYAGEYYPRRFLSNNLSLEYLEFYKKQAGKKTIALVTGIYESETIADSALKVLKPLEKAAFKVKANIYIGCMH